MTDVYVEPTGRIIEPFGEAAEEMPVLNLPLRERRRRFLAEGGFTPIPEERRPCLVIPDNLFATGIVLRRFVDACSGKDAVLVLKDGSFASRTAPLQGLRKVHGGYRFDRIRYLGSEPGDAIEVLVDPEEKVIPVPTPASFVEGEPLEVALPRHPVLTVHHWMHLLAMNQAAGAAEARAIPTWKGVLLVAGAVLRARSVNRHRILGKLNRIGKGCDIHPTAVIEGSTLGKKVTVGPNARVLFSTIGDESLLMPGAQVEVSTLGERCTVAQNCTLRFSLLFPEAIASQLAMQRSVLGRRAVTTLGSFSIDLNFDREIRVAHDGRLQGSGTRFLGAAYGHRCRIGTGLFIASGRMIPNDSVIVRPKSGVIARIPPNLPTGRALTNRDGTLGLVED